MPIKELQQRLSQVGVIRLGEQRLSKNNKPYPAKLDTFRVTSPSKRLVEAVAALYGGEVRAWPEGPGGGQWEVITKVTEIPVHVLPQRIDPNYELWGNGFKARLCDGETEKIRNCPCICGAERDEVEAAGKVWQRDPRRHCKPTTRLSVMLSDVPSLGTWKLESHGWNAAAELPTLAVAILNQVQRPVPAILRMEQREDKKLTVGADGENVETRKYAVPVLDFGELATPRQALGGGMDTVLSNAVESGPKRQAIGSAPAEVESDRRKLTESRVLELAAELKTIEALQELWRAAAADKVLTDAVKQVLTQRSNDIQKPAQTDAAKAPAAGATALAVDSRAPDSSATDDAEVAHVEPDRDQVWGDIMRAAKPLGWNLTVVETKYREQMGHDPNEEELATGWKYEEFLAAVKSGAVK